MTAALETRGLGKRYGRRWGLADCTLEIPEGRVAALIGPNGAGKTTLLHLAVGLLPPTSGSIEVLGQRWPTATGGPAAGGDASTAALMARLGFVAQESPTYSRLNVADHLRLGARLNPRWDKHLAEERISHLGLDPAQRAGKLSGGQRAQLALTLAMAKRPDLLVLDEPAASLDPLARREFLQSLMEFVAERGVSVILSSHLVSDLERVCDYVVLLTASRVRIAGDVDEVLASHRRITGPRRDPHRLPGDLRVIDATHTDRQSTMLVHTGGPIHDPSWAVEEVGLEDIVLAYMRQPPEPGPPTGSKLREVVRS